MKVVLIEVFAVVGIFHTIVLDDQHTPNLVGRRKRIEWHKKRKVAGPIVDF